LDGILLAELPLTIGNTNKVNAGNEVSAILVLFVLYGGEKKTQKKREKKGNTIEA